MAKKRTIRKIIDFDREKIAQRLKPLKLRLRFDLMQEWGSLGPEESDGLMFEDEEGRIIDLSWRNSTLIIFQNEADNRLQMERARKAAKMTAEEQIAAEDMFAAKEEAERVAAQKKP